MREGDDVDPWLTGGPEIHRARGSRQHQENREQSPLPPPPAAIRAQPVRGGQQTRGRVIPQAVHRMRRHATEDS
jgi:hypothetical protein